MPRRRGEPFKVKFRNIAGDEFVLDYPESEKN